MSMVMPLTTQRHMLHMQFGAHFLLESVLEVVVGIIVQTPVPVLLAAQTRGVKWAPRRMRTPLGQS